MNILFTSVTSVVLNFLAKPLEFLCQLFGTHKLASDSSTNDIYSVKPVKPTVELHAGLIFPLFDVVSAQEVPLQYTQCIIHELTSVFLCVPFIFADSKKC